MLFSCTNLYYIFVASKVLLRVNGILPHVDAWYDAFGVSEKDKLYLSKKNA